MIEAYPPASFQVSLSAYQVWQRCEQRYYYSYVRRLRIKDKFLAPALGRILHSYLETYYEGLRDGMLAEDAHTLSQLKTSERYVPELRGYANVAHMTGNDDLARELTALPALAGCITDRYYLARGRPDSLRYKILEVEKKLNLTIFEGIYSTGVTDLVTQDQDTGRINLWEHKSTQYVPPDSVRLRDFQTMLYAVKLRWKTGLVIDSVLWNYIRTKEPSQPEVLKSGYLTKRKDLDTTWEVYSRAVLDSGGDPNAPEYGDMMERLFPRELNVFFPRYEQVIVVQEDMLMDDYISEAQNMRRAVYDWSAGTKKPIRTIARDCDGCEFLRLCQAALTGGDEEDLVKMRYTEGKYD